MRAVGIIPATSYNGVVRCGPADSLFEHSATVRPQLLLLETVQDGT